MARYKEEYLDTERLYTLVGRNIQRLRQQAGITQEELAGALYCTQKQICDQYLLPRQTINHVINALRDQGILREQVSLAPGREKAFVLTERGESYMGPFLASMNAMETRAVLRMGPEKLAELTDLMEQYSQALRKAMEETRETGDGHGETLRF